MCFRIMQQGNSVENDTFDFKRMVIVVVKLSISVYANQFAQATPLMNMNLSVLWSYRNQH